MSGRIADSSVADVKARTDILEVASGFTTLKRSGQWHVGLCPFHDEKTGSFSVKPETGYFECFGCGVSGDVIELLEKRGMEFRDAVEYLADRAGVELEYEGDDDGSLARARAEAHEAGKEELRTKALAAEHYHETLLKGADAKAKAAYEYLTIDRGFTRETLDTNRIGYAHPEQGFCAVAVKKHGISEETLDAAGLRIKGGQDFFGGRIVFPIRDERGRGVGFGGRVMPDAPETWIDRDGVEQTTRKYLNSRTSGLFKKSDLLYGLDVAQSAIRKKKHAIVVEGYTDVLALHQVGVKHVVATLGTATSTHDRVVECGRGQVGDVVVRLFAIAALLTLLLGPCGDAVVGAVEVGYEVRESNARLALSVAQSGSAEIVAAGEYAANSEEK